MHKVLVQITRQTIVEHAASIIIEVDDDMYRQLSTRPLQAKHWAENVVPSSIPVDQWVDLHGKSQVKFETKNIEVFDEPRTSVPAPSRITELARSAGTTPEAVTKVLAELAGLVAPSTAALPILTQGIKGNFIYSHGDERIELKASSLRRAVSEIILMGKPCPYVWSNMDGQESEIPRAALPDGSRFAGDKPAVDQDDLRYLLDCVEHHIAKFPVPSHMMERVERLRAVLPEKEKVE